MYSSKETHIHKQNISYYDTIADSYDQILEQSDSNKLIRQKVKEKFISQVQQGYVVDFGGGTGGDLGWLSANNYKIIFCEPSVGMREKAIQYNKNVLHSDNIIFLDTEKTNFTNWLNVAPVSHQVDAILSNFNVVNNIPDIETLFKHLAFILKPGGHFILLLLNMPLKKMLKKGRLEAVRSFIFQTPFRLRVSNNGLKQIVFIHTIKNLKKASAPYFSFCSAEVLDEPGFTLMHLVKK